MKRASAILITSTALVLLPAACGSAPIGDPARGQTLFNSGGPSKVPCSNCHTLDGSYRVGPSLEGIASSAESRVEGMSAQQYLRESITNPSAHIADGYTDTMYKDYGKELEAQDINNLIAFLLEQK